MPQFPEGIIFWYDGAPPHYANIVHEFLDTSFLKQGIRSFRQTIAKTIPGSEQLKIYLWGYMKHHVYSALIKDNNNLKQRSETLFTLLQQASLMWRGLEYCLDVSRDTDGAHIKFH